MGAIVRVAGWEERLTAVVDGSRETVFAWGRHDCAKFAGRCVEAVTGVNPMDGFSYDNPILARVYIGRDGVKIVAMADQTLGEGYPAVRAHRGDVVACKTEHGIALGVCMGANAAFAAPIGIAWRRVIDCFRSWPVGR